MKIKYVTGNKLNNFYLKLIWFKRDLKPENFLLKYEDDIKSIKMIDFGLSKKVAENEILTQPNGTVH